MGSKQTMQIRFRNGDADKIGVPRETLDLASFDLSDCTWLVVEWDDGSQSMHRIKDITDITTTV